MLPFVDQCMIDEGFGYPGMDLNVATATNKDKRNSAVECRQLCNEDLQCKYFTWNSENKACFKKTGKSRKKANTIAISGSACRKGGRLITM